MNIFNKIIKADNDAAFRLGSPAPNEEAHARRLAAMELLNPNGFKTKPNTPAKNADGLTRGQRRRLKQAEYMAKVSEDRPLKYMHSAARNRVYDAATTIEPLAA